MEPIEDNNTDTVQCQLYNYWTGAGTGVGDDCRFIIQSPTGVAYMLTYPMFKHYKDTQSDVRNRLYAMLEYHLITTNHTYTETWIASISYEHMCLIRDYGQPVDMPKLDWMLTYEALQEEIEEVSAWLEQMLAESIDLPWNEDI
jgi:hypothetical protein